MIKFVEVRDLAKKEKHDIDMGDFIFSLLYAQGYPISDCYIISKYRKEITMKSEPKSKAAKNEKQKTIAVLSSAGTKVLKEPKIQWLIALLRPIYIEDIKKYVFANMDDFDFINTSQKKKMIEDNVRAKLDVSGEFDELSPTALKKILTSLVKDLKDDPNAAKDLLSSIKLYIDKFSPPDNGDGDYFSKNFVEIVAKFMSVCENCGREIDLPIDLDINIPVICPHCKVQIDLKKEKEKKRG